MDNEIRELLVKNDQIYEAKQLINKYEFLLSEIPDCPTISVSIYYASWMSHDPYYYKLSHYTHTPVQAGPYTPSAPFCSSEALALHRAIDAITCYVKAAIKDGYAPSAEWLKQNASYQG